MDRNEYINTSEDFIRSGPYEEIPKDPLPGMVRRTKEAVKRAAYVFGEEESRFQLKMHVSNPVVPRFYTQLKLHKPGRKLRPITSNNNSPTEKLAIWLLKKFKSMKTQYETHAIQNSMEFVNKVKDLEIADNEIQVSFDVESLYPNVPIDKALELLREWLTLNQLSTNEVDELVNLTRVCMTENCFQFNGKFYRQHFGCSMGSPLSPFIANLFMSFFETNMKNEGYFPEVWIRYVDDVWAKIKKHRLRQFMNRLNNTGFKSIKFTCEEECEQRLNFLDVTVIKNNGKFEFDIYRKPTNTLRYITSDSYHPFRHKIAAFHSMIFRALNIPMSNERKEFELNKIKHIANINGYKEQLIDELILSHRRKRNLRDITTLDTIRESDETYKYCSFGFHQQINKEICRIMAKHKMIMSECSETRLKNLIGGSKDRIPEHQLSGIYSIKCNDCDDEYVGQSRRKIEIRYKEHRTNTVKGEIDKSSIARHMIDNDHNFSISNLKLIQRVDKSYKLNAYESYHISKRNNLINENEGPILNPIFSKVNV